MPLRNSRNMYIEYLGSGMNARPSRKFSHRFFGRMLRNTAPFTLRLAEDSPPQSLPRKRYGAGIQDMRDVDGFRAPVRERACAGMTGLTTIYLHSNNSAPAQESDQSPNLLIPQINLCANGSLFLRLEAALRGAGRCLDAEP